MLEFRGYTFNSSPTTPTPHTRTRTGERSDSFWPESASKRRRRKKSPAEKRQARQGGTKARASKENFVAALHRCCSFCSFVRSFFLSFLPSFLPSFFLSLFGFFPSSLVRSLCWGNVHSPEEHAPETKQEPGFYLQGGHEGKQGEETGSLPPLLVTHPHPPLRACFCF